MNRFFLYSIRLYRRYVSPLFPPSCRFVPTCSEYALEAFKKKSAVKAVFMTVVRILKCHPFHPGGYDPVEPVLHPNISGFEQRDIPQSRQVETIAGSIPLENKV